MYYGLQHYPQYKAVIHHRELAIAMQLFRHITDALAAKAVAFLLGYRQAVPQLSGGSFLTARIAFSSALERMAVRSTSE